MKKKAKKCMLVVGIFLFISIAWIVFDAIRYVYNLFYTNIDITYLGKAEGVETDYFDPPTFWLEYRYLYCGNGYHYFTTYEGYERLCEECSLQNFDFNLKIHGNKMYIYSYGVPIDKLEYYKGHLTVFGDYYNRAEFSKEKFKEGVYYFYEIDDVGIGDMLLEDMYFFERREYGMEGK